MSITGILLAAGESRRFGSDKLLHPLADGRPIAVAAAQVLCAAVDNTLAVVRPGSTELTDLLSRESPLHIVTCVEANRGMGASLACGVKASLNAQAWVIALADMPFIQVITIKQLVALLNKGASIVAPQYQGKRGHPVGFSQQFVTQLSQLTGTMGARSVLQQNHTQVTLFSCDDAGIHCDVDTPRDLEI